MLTITQNLETYERPAWEAEPWASPAAEPWSESVGVLVAGDEDLDEDESYFLETDEDDDGEDDYDDGFVDDEDDDLDDDADDADEDDDDL